MPCGRVMFHVMGGEKIVKNVIHKKGQSSGNLNKQISYSMANLTGKMNIIKKMPKKKIPNSVKCES